MWVEQIADRDRLAVGREFGEEVGEVIVVVQLAVTHQQHDAGRGELLGKRCQAEIGLRIDGMQGAQIGDAVPAAKCRTPVADDENGSSGGVAGFKR